MTLVPALSLLLMAASPSTFVGYSPALQVFDFLMLKDLNADGAETRSVQNLLKIGSTRDTRILDVLNMLDCDEKSPCSHTYRRFAEGVVEIRAGGDEDLYRVTVQLPSNICIRPSDLITEGYRIVSNPYDHGLRYYMSQSSPLVTAVVFMARPTDCASSFAFSRSGRSANMPKPRIP